MVNLKLDASPGKKQKGVPKDKEGRKAYYERLIEIYAAQNPVKFETKREELEKKRDGFEYIAGKWVNVFDPKTLKEEIKLTASQKELAAEQEKVDRVAELEARNKELEERLGALEANKPKGRPKKIK
mgnify:CR=1 FL=1